MYKILLLSFLVFTASLSHANDEIRSTIVRITGPKTKSILTKFIADLKKADSSISFYHQTQIPDITYVSAQFDKLNDRQALSLMRGLSVEAANCPDQSESKEIPLNSRTEFLKRCYSHAINETLWSGINFGAWDVRARQENKVSLFSYGVSTAYRNLKLSQVNLIKSIVEKIDSELDKSLGVIKSRIEMASFY